MLASEAAEIGRSGDAGADAVRERRVDFTREMVRNLLEPNPDVAFKLLDKDASDALAQSPIAVDIREWQSLAADLATALMVRRPELSAQARELAVQLRQRAIMAARNPADRLAMRPTSRKVLQAVFDAGSAGCLLTEIRQRTGMSQTHMSNVIRLLSAHGFIKTESDPEDGRGKVVHLTQAAKVALHRAEVRRGGPSLYPVHVEERANVRGDRFDPLQIQLQSRHERVPEGEGA